MAKPRLCEWLHRLLLSQAASKISEVTALIPDLSDIRKKYARKMEYVIDVRGGLPLATCPQHIVPGRRG